MRMRRDLTLCVILCAPKPTGQRRRISITRWRCASGTRAHVLVGKWESEDPTYDIHWREISSTNRTSLFDSAEDKGAIEPCGPTKCGWDIISDEGSSVEDLRDLIDVVSVSNDAENIQFTRFTSRTKLDKILSFHGRTGRFSEIMKGRCDSDEVVNTGAVASPLR